MINLPAILIMASNDFLLDTEEFKSVFKVFDREGTGKIQIE